MIDSPRSAQALDAGTIHAVRVEQVSLEWPMAVLIGVDVHSGERFAFYVQPHAAEGLARQVASVSSWEELPITGIEHRQLAGR